MPSRLAARALPLCIAAALMAVTAGVLPAAAQQSPLRWCPACGPSSTSGARPDGVCLGVGAVDVDAGRLVGAVVVLRASGPIGPVRLVPGTERLYDIDCPPGGSCMAVGIGTFSTAGPVVVQVSRDGTPGVPVVVPGMTDVSDVACPTATTCLVTGIRRTFTYPYSPTIYLFSVLTNGQPGPVQRLPRRMTDAVGIDCPTATRCLVSGANGFGVLTNVDGAWVGDFQQFWSPTGSPDGEVSCGSPTTCNAIPRGFVPTGGTGHYAVPAMIPVTTDGVAGPVQLLTDRQGSSNGISCVFGRNCTVVGLLHSAGAISVDVFRGTPMPPRIWPGAIAFLGVSCVAPATCGMVGYGPDGAVFAWYGPVPA